MQYHKHMSNMRNDPEVRRLIAKYGLEGYGLYNLALESICDRLSNDDPMPDLVESADDIADFYHADADRVREILDFMVKHKLLETEGSNGKLSCRKIYKYLQSSQTRSPAIRELITSYVNERAERLRLSETVIDSLRPSQTVRDGLCNVTDERGRRLEEKRRLGKGSEGKTTGNVASLDGGSEWDEEEEVVAQ